MRILLIHSDRFPWATTNRAKSLKEHLKDDEVEIADIWHLPDGDKYDVIHFLYSGGITKHKDYILKYKDKVFTTLASNRTLDSYFGDKWEDMKEIYESTQGCVCHNPRLLNELQAKTNAKATYIPNGVDTEKFNRNFVAGFVGIKADRNDHKGEGLVRTACDELGLKLEVVNRDVPHDQMPEFYKKIDCLVLASQSEGCNNPTLEALAMNKPVISTDVGIARELEGVIIVERNVESIKEALRKLSGRIQILEEFTWDKISQKYKNVWNSGV